MSTIDAWTGDRLSMCFQKTEFPKPNPKKHTPGRKKELKTLRDAKEKINDKHVDDTVDPWNEI